VTAQLFAQSLNIGNSFFLRIGPYDGGSCVHATVRATGEGGSSASLMQPVSQTQSQGMWTIGTARVHIVDCHDAQCDRVSPCEACCLRNIPEQCEYQLTEGARKPVLQAVELRLVRAENVKMKERMRRIISDKQVKLDDNDSDESPAMNDGLKLSPKVPVKPAGLRQKKFMTGEPTDNLYFGTPGLASVITDASIPFFARIHVACSSPIVRQPEC